jgi:hypothetical protein
VLQKSYWRRQWEHHREHYWEESSTIAPTRTQKTCECSSNWAANQLKEVVKKVGGWYNSVIDNIHHATNLPFTRKIVKLPLPSKFKVSQIDLYEKFKDLGGHAETTRPTWPWKGSGWDHVSNLHPHFESTRKRWFNRLSSRLIESCVELGKHFLTHFTGNYKRKRPAVYLLTLKQGENESLKDFMARFNTEELSVDDHAA